MASFKATRGALPSTRRRGVVLHAKGLGARTVGPGLPAQRSPAETITAESRRANKHSAQRARVRRHHARRGGRVANRGQIDKTTNGYQLRERKRE